MTQYLIFRIQSLGFPQDTCLTQGTLSECFYLRQSFNISLFFHHSIHGPGVYLPHAIWTQQLKTWLLTSISIFYEIHYQIGWYFSNTSINFSSQQPFCRLSRVHLPHFAPYLLCPHQSFLLHLLSFPSLFALTHTPHHHHPPAPNLFPFTLAFSSASLP